MKHASLFILSLTLATGIAFADEGKSAPEHASVAGSSEAATVDAFATLDVNHDGVLSKAEMSHHPKSAHMAMVDEDQDGTLSREEFAALEGM